MWLVKRHVAGQVVKCMVKWPSGPLVHLIQWASGQVVDRSFGQVVTRSADHMVYGAVGQLIACCVFNINRMRHPKQRHVA